MQASDELGWNKIIWNDKLNTMRQMKLHGQDVLVGQLHKYKKGWLCSEKLLQGGLLPKKS